MSALSIPFLLTVLNAECIVGRMKRQGKKFKKGVDKRKISCYPIIPFGGVNIYIKKVRHDDFIGVYHPHPDEDPTPWNKKKDTDQQLDLFKDYKPPLPLWKRMLNKLLRRT